MQGAAAEDDDAGSKCGTAAVPGGLYGAVQDSAGGTGLRSTCTCSDMSLLLLVSSDVLLHA